MFNNNNDNNTLVTMLLTFVSMFFIFKYRYRLINLVLGTRWIRRLAVTGALQIPYIRERVFNRFMPF